MVIAIVSVSVTDWSLLTMSSEANVQNVKIFVTNVSNTNVLLDCQVVAYQSL